MIPPKSPDVHRHFTGERRQRHLNRLRRAFPGLCRELAEDALQDLALGLWARQARGAPPCDERALDQYAWRAMRNLWRGTSRRRENELRPDRGGSARATDPLDHLELLSRVHRLLPAAARRFGGTRPEALARALEERLEGEEPEAVIARRYGVPRESINRAMRWIRDALQSTAPAARRSTCSRRSRT